MGLTIHWELAAGNIPAKDARRRVEELRQVAKRLPFVGVGPLVALRGKECYFKAGGDDTSWLLCQAGQHAKLGGGFSRRVEPTRLYAFSVDVGDGAEEANFGLARYPATVEHEGRRVRTGLSGWCWQSFCKTQYASNPECGGVQNFLQCHISVVALLCRAEEMGLVKEVSDEGDYWEKGDVAALAQEVGEWNSMIAAFAGELKDALGDSGAELQAPILERQDFEHLEADGNQRL